MGKHFHWKIIFIVLIIAGSVWALYPPSEKVHLGLDLKGGVHLLLRVETEKLNAQEKEGAVERAVEVIRNRIDQFGVREPSVSKQGIDQIVVQLPGLSDEARARDIVSKTAHLEFKLVREDDALLRELTSSANPAAVEKKTETPDAAAAPAEPKEPVKVPDDVELKELKEERSISSQMMLLEKNPVLTGSHLTNATVGFDQYGQPVVEFQLDDEGARIFDDATFKNIGKRLAIVLDGKVHSAPVIRDRIPGGKGQISGNFTPAEASDLALILRAGALPAPVKVLEQRVIGATLGKDSITKGIQASIGGAVLVVLFMIVFYQVPGIIASVAVLLNLLILMGFMAISGASMSLPGIAGVILTIGMAVDANVLINERMRDEMKLGKAIRSVISAGYHKAFSAIFDSNITTVLSAAILLWFGSGPVRGFAVTLIFGLAASFFTALFVTRVIFDFLTRGNHTVSLKMLEIMRNANFDWIAKRHVGYVISISLIIGSLFLIATRGEKQLGIDFKGGALVEVKFNESPDIGKIRSELEKTNLKDAQLQLYGEPSENTIVIRTKGEDTAEMNRALMQAVGAGKYEIRRSDSVGPSASRDLFSKGIKALLLGLLAMLIYMWYRFNFRFAFCATLMLLHDAVGSIGLFLLTGREFSVPIIAAVLTIIGYSINDTIVIYDRLRENLKIMRKSSVKDILNVSMNQMLGRTILTSVTTVLVVLALYIFGGPAINDFAFVLLSGFVLGVYSTIFFAAPLIYETSPKN